MHTMSSRFVPNTDVFRGAESAIGLAADALVTLPETTRSRLREQVVSWLKSVKLEEAQGRIVGFTLDQASGYHSTIVTLMLLTRDEYEAFFAGLKANDSLPVRFAVAILGALDPAASIESMLRGAGLEREDYERSLETVRLLIESVIDVCQRGGIEDLRQMFATSFAPHLKDELPPERLNDRLSKEMGSEGYLDFIEASAPLLERIAIELYEKTVPTLDRAYEERHTLSLESDDPKTITNVCAELGVMILCAEYMIRKYLAEPLPGGKVAEPQIARLAVEAVCHSLREALCMRFLSRRFGGIFVRDEDDDEVEDQRHDQICLLERIMDHILRTTFVNDVSMSAILQSMVDQCLRMMWVQHAMECPSTSEEEEGMGAGAQCPFIPWLSVACILHDEDSAGLEWTEDSGGVDYRRTITLNWDGQDGEVVGIRWASGVQGGVAWGDTSLVPLDRIIDPSLPYARSLRGLSRSESRMRYAAMASIEENVLSALTTCDIPLRFIDEEGRGRFLLLTTQEIQSLIDAGFDRPVAQPMPETMHALFRRLGYPLPTSNDGKDLPVSECLLHPIERPENRDEVPEPANTQPLVFV